jgi:hypothetical protein
MSEGRKKLGLCREYRGSKTVERGKPRNDEKRNTDLL